MANEPDNLVLAHLREIHAALADHSARFDQIAKRFDQLDKRFEDFRALVNHTLSMSTTSYLKAREADRRHEMSESRQRIDERMDELERRLARVEQEIGS